MTEGHEHVNANNSRISVAYRVGKEGGSTTEDIL